MLLVRHKALDVYRAAKIISKSSQNAYKLLQEANLMKNLEHPGIPLIYDIEEDSNSICIIEEYIAGKSLRMYMEQDKHMEIGRICQFSIELCKILEYIHNSSKEGIAHLDLKPDNILIDEKLHLWLIDFDNAVAGNGTKEVCEGSIHFAAPEQYHRLKSGKQADIYSLGMILLYMVNDQNVQSRVDEIQQHMLYPIIQKCLRHSRGGRYESVTPIRKQLEKVQNVWKKEKSTVKEHSVVIRITGVRHGIGVTHLSMCMASVLQQQGIHCLCMDLTFNQHMSLAGMQGKLMADGTYQYEGISILPDYKGRIQCSPTPFQVILLDTCNHSAFNQQDTWERYCYDAPYQMIDIIVTDGKYREGRMEQWIQNKAGKKAVFVNHMNGRQFYKYTRKMQTSLETHAIPCIYQWNRPGTFFENVVKEFIQELSPELETHMKRNRLEGIQLEVTKLFYKVRNRRRTS